MSSKAETKDNFVFSDEEDRPYIASSESPRFRVGDKVKVLNSDGTDDGPFFVASVISVEKCSLSLENGQTARNGEVVQMARLEAA